MADQRLFSRTRPRSLANPLSEIASRYGRPVPRADTMGAGAGSGLVPKSTDESRWGRQPLPEQRRLFVERAQGSSAFWGQSQPVSSREEGRAALDAKGETAPYFKTSFRPERTPYPEPFAPPIPLTATPSPAPPRWPENRAEPLSAPVSTPEWASEIPGFYLMNPNAQVQAIKAYRYKKELEKLQTMVLSDAGLELIMQYEQSPRGGPARRPYGSLEGGAQTVGYGHKIQPGEDFSAELTDDQARELLRRDVQRFEQKVRDRVKVPLTQAQFDALVSLAFNLRDPSFREPQSSLLRELNAGNYEAAADAFEIYKRSGERKYDGLKKRRAAEQAMFSSEPYWSN